MVPVKNYKIEYYAGWFKRCFRAGVSSEANYQSFPYFHVTFFNDMFFSLLTLPTLIMILPQNTLLTSCNTIFTQVFFSFFVCFFNIYISFFFYNICKTCIVIRKSLTFSINTHIIHISILLYPISTTKNTNKLDEIFLLRKISILEKEYGITSTDMMELNYSSSEFNFGMGFQEFKIFILEKFWIFLSLFFLFNEYLFPLVWYFLSTARQ